MTSPEFSSIQQIIAAITMHAEVEKTTEYSSHSEEYGSMMLHDAETATPQPAIKITFPTSLFEETGRDKRQQPLHENFGPVQKTMQRMKELGFQIVRQEKKPTENKITYTFIQK